MYDKIKFLINPLLHKKFILNNELFFRSIYAIFYKGNNYQCIICDYKLDRFIPFQVDELMCPKCGSSKRDRKLYHILTTNYLKEGIKVLDFSPSRCLYRKLKPDKRIEYISTTYAGNFFADKNEDITCINESDNTFDLIICYHVLEHIENDISAMSELYRILKRNGNCIIQTPFKEGNIYEDATITSEEERIKHFGQNDHVRVYSVDGLRKRLESVGFIVNPQQYTEDNYYGFKEDTILFCTKQ